jgi:uncharacterized membrane protein YvlD (DUF360 family)
MPVRIHLPGYRGLHVSQNTAVRTGVYTGVGLAFVFTTWLFLANRVPFFEPFALERNTVAAAMLGFLALIPVLRFFRLPGRLLVSGLLGWGIFSLVYRVLCIFFSGLNDRHSTFQIFMLGAVLYMIVVTLSWLGTCIWKAREAHAAHSNHHVS